MIVKLLNIENGNVCMTNFNALPLENTLITLNNYYFIVKKIVYRYCFSYNPSHNGESNIHCIPSFYEIWLEPAIEYNSNVRKWKMKKDVAEFIDKPIDESFTAADKQSNIPHFPCQIDN